MKLQIKKYKNRKLYIDSNREIIKSLQGSLLGSRYTTLDELRYFVARRKIKIQVTDFNGSDITKCVLLDLLLAKDFTEKDLYDLVEKQSLSTLVLNNSLSEIPVYTSGTEL